jgi:hypothetical protein
MVQGSGIGVRDVLNGPRTWVNLLNSEPAISIH